MVYSAQMEQRILGLIPTRGGSKGVEGKNIILLEGRPMLAYTIEAAQQCRRLSTVMVTTDNDQIEEVAQQYGARTNRHPPELSYDGQPTFPVIRQVVTSLRNQGEHYDLVVTMRATSPLRTAFDINSALELMDATEADSVVSMVADETGHPMRLKYLSEDRRVIPLMPGEEDSPLPRQAIPTVYRRNGAVYVTRADVILDGSLFGKDSRGFVMPKRRSININDADDILIAAALLRYANQTV